MKPAPFTIARPAALDAAQQTLHAASHDTKIISGGQSLGPMLNLRLARPERLVDITGLPELTEIRQTATHVEIGAAVTHARIEDGEVPDPIPGMLRHVASGIAYRAVRNRGTIGGSLCHADPAADWVTAMTALGALLVVRSGSSGVREIPMSGFMLGAYRTAMEAGEFLTTVRIPRYSPRARWGYYKICRKVGEFADAIAAFVADPETRTCRVVFGSTGGAPLACRDLARHIATTGGAAPLATVKTVLRDSGLDLSEVKIHQLAVAHRRAVSGALSDV
ncbi:FAD binding domain-containing protein [Albidovulum sediminicola]|uniref:FAD binding domain-containing protein n=1 Tax=Albidovulum sediminicola TaxID=2984331 RepID=A0ABT2Z5D3_9RHOB|nr:FAD binding domain-containing protein [Defluviimonas sp. WL0075]MCV2866313.1 FAD binding domain-containing protein [Defluviimonas sp. WL0075]